MKDTIIGYNDYYYDKHEYHIIQNAKTKTMDRIDDYSPNDLNKFFLSEASCPFCNINLSTVFLATNALTMTTDMFTSYKVKECPHCKWWTYKIEFEDRFTHHSIKTDERFYGIIKEFNPNDKQIPINVLTSELKKRPELLYHINPYKLEELCQSILKGVYDCEVIHVGKTGDGGKDLLILNSDSPIVVQVKRRSNPNHIELIDEIRELVGTLYIEDYRKGLFISTAKDFSQGSKKLANELLSNRKVDYFEYINYDKLYSLIKNHSEEKPWKKIVDPLYSYKNAHIYDTPKSISEYKKDIDNIKLELGITIKTDF